MFYTYFYRVCCVTLVFVAYYKYGKDLIINFAPTLTRHLSLTKYFPKHDIEGTIELILIAISHMFFCILLILVIPITWPTISLSWPEIPSYFIYGILLGIGCMGISGLICKIVIQLISIFSKNYCYDLKKWLTISRGGWIKHHLQSIEILPIYFSLAVLAIQVGSEEIIFRGVLLNYFMEFSMGISFVTALTLFIIMQMFLMNRWEAALFPMIGAAVMGIAHSILYLQVPLLWPLIVAHITFFLFFVI